VENHLQIGEIVNTRGIKGEIKVIPLTDDPKRFSELDWVYVEVKGMLNKYDIQSVKYLPPFVVVKLKGVDSVEAAEKLVDSFILVDRANAVKLPENSWFICDIIGCTVYEEDGDILGEVADVLRTGSNDVYLVKCQGKKDILIPALKSVVKEVSVESRKIVVSIPEGLIDE